MIAFSILGRPVYWYGIAYTVTFLGGYCFLSWIVKKHFLSSVPKVHDYLKNSLDDFVIFIILAILLGGRLGHVFLYERAYYRQYPIEIFAFHQGGMAFLGGVMGVVLMLLWIQWKQKFSLEELKVVGDLILCIVPLGIFLGRIANFLNQEMVGKIITSFPLWFQKIATYFGLIHVYNLIDNFPRFNVNIVQAFFEGLLPGIVGFILFFMIYSNTIKRTYRSKVQKGIIVSFFFIRYGIIRFVLEFTKDIPSYEYIGNFTISQYLALILIFAGLWLLQKK